MHVFTCMHILVVKVSMWLKVRGQSGFYMGSADWNSSHQNLLQVILPAEPSPWTGQSTF